MSQIIAIPIEKGVLCPHFGHCEAFAVIKVTELQADEAQIIIPPEHQPGLYPKWIAQFGVTDVIAGGMGQKAIELFNEQNINVFVGAPIQSAKDLVNDFLKGNLSLESNYCDH